MSLKNKIAVITPIEHLQGVKKLLESKGEIFYLQHGSKQEVRTLLLVKKIAEKNSVNFSLRDKSLCGDVEVVDVYIDILKNLNEKFDLVVCLQPDHPDREHTFDYCVDYMVDNNYDDLITIEPSFKRSGSVRIFKYDHLIKSKVSLRIGCIKDDATDIHYLEDLEKARKKF